MLTRNDVTRLFAHPSVLAMYRVFLRMRDEGYPDQNYVGINFRGDDIVSVKFYFAVYRRLTPEEVSMFLPRTADFLKYYHLWDASTERSHEHTGCTFEVKFKGSLEPILGFHYRLRATDEAYALMGPATLLPFDPRQLGTRPGINYEYEKGRVLRKRYYYFESVDQKRYIATRFEKPFAMKCAFAEYAEFDDEAKVNLWRFDYSDENLSRPSGFSRIARDVIDNFQSRYGLINISDGYYEKGDVMATYFFGTAGGSKNDPFPDPVNFHLDTMRFLV